MISKIQLLDEQTINQIAAGEVIENPASVVKELVENALDAEATEIAVEIKGGGRQLIRVSDNGCGMNHEDAEKCLERHATSKIRAIHDIHEIRTMGFRGEAIPSIASISKMSILTRAKEAEMGTLISIDGGKISERAQIERDPGTTIEVGSLFFNVPVRKKFQRSPSYDTQEVQKIVSSLALANPGVKFSLISQGKSLLKTSFSPEKSFRDQLKARISEVLGKEFAMGLIPLKEENQDIRLIGFIGEPHCNRHNRTGQHLLINGRVVFSPLVSFSVKEGYGTAMGTHRHPVFVLHLIIPGDQVDVNVHPQKREVRLRQSQHLKDLIIKAVENSLRQGEVPTTTHQVEFRTPPSLTYAPPLEPFYQPKEWIIRETPSIEPKMETAPLFQPQSLSNSRKVMATIQGYILVKLSDLALIWVDQRRAHARVLFEMLDAKHQPAVPIQQLLIPLTFDFSANEAASIKTHLKILEKWGLGIHEFGPNSFSVDAVPQLWKEAQLEKLLHSVAEDADQTTVSNKNKLIEKISRSALPKEKKLMLNEAQSLIDQLFKCHSPKFCPAGKPTMKEISHTEIAKLFET